MKKQLRIKDETIEVELVSSIFGKARGLMFSKRKNLLFLFDKKQKVSLHMFFVFYPILVLFLDKNNCVVEKAILKPFTLYTPKHASNRVLEIAEDIEKFNAEIRIGSCLRVL